MGDTIRERKQALATVSTSTKIELVEALRREKEKTARHLADARAQRERAKSEALKVKIVVDPSASRPFKDLVARATANHPALTKLDFSVGAWWLSGADVLALAEVLKHNTTVTDVNFHGNSLAAQGAAALADALRVNSCITALNLGGNQITSVGARSLAESLQSPTCALRSLLLYSNAITDDGVFELAFALGSSKTGPPPPVCRCMPCSRHPRCCACMRPSSLAERLLLFGREPQAAQKRVLGKGADGSSLAMGGGPASAWQHGGPACRCPHPRTSGAQQHCHAHAQGGQACYEESGVFTGNWGLALFSGAGCWPGGWAREAVGFLGGNATEVE